MPVEKWAQTLGAYFSKRAIVFAPQSFFVKMSFSWLLL